MDEVVKAWRVEGALMVAAARKMDEKIMSLAIEVIKHDQQPGRGSGKREVLGQND